MREERQIQVCENPKLLRRAHGVSTASYFFPVLSGMIFPVLLNGLCGQSCTYKVNYLDFDQIQLNWSTIYSFEKCTYGKNFFPKVNEEVGLSVRAIFLKRFTSQYFPLRQNRGRWLDYCDSLASMAFENCLVFRKCRYRSGTVNSNTFNSKFHLIRSFFEIFATFLSFHV